MTLIEEINEYLCIQNAMIRSDEQVIGQFQPDLVLSADQDTINPSLASQPESVHHWHTSEAPDAHYYQAQGQEPPVEEGNFYQGVVNLIGFTVAGAFFVWALLAYGLPMVIGGVLRWLGV